MTFTADIALECGGAESGEPAARFRYVVHCCFVGRLDLLNARVRVVNALTRGDEERHYHSHSAKYHDLEEQYYEKG